MEEKDFVELSDEAWARSDGAARQAGRSRRPRSAYHEADTPYQARSGRRSTAQGDDHPPRQGRRQPSGERSDGFGQYLDATLKVLCGGRIAEQKKTGDVSSGASMDIKMATQYARAMVLEWGMSDRVGFLNYAGENSREMFLPEKEYSDETARVIDEEVRRIVDAAFDDCNRLVERHWDEVTAVAEALLRYETIADGVDRLMKGEKIRPTVAELLAAETSHATATAADVGGRGRGTRRRHAAPPDLRSCVGTDASPPQAGPGQGRIQAGITLDTGRGRVSSGLVHHAPAGTGRRVRRWLRKDRPDRRTPAAVPPERFTRTRNTIQ